MRVPAAVRELDIEPVVFTGAGKQSHSASVPSKSREVLECARKFQEHSAKAGAKRPQKRGRKTYSTAYATPHVSVGAGCHTSQVKEFNEYYKSRGIIGAEHREDGALVSNSNRAFNRVLEARGLFNRDAGYSDFAGNASD